MNTLSLMLSITPSGFAESLTDPTSFYLRFRREFASLPAIVRSHRDWFKKEKRGYGEDAFHVMWWLIFVHFRPAQFLEIGVFRGQTLSLAALLQKELGIEGCACGVTPLRPLGDSVSRYPRDVDYQQDLQLNFDRFKLGRPRIVRARSEDARARKFIRGRLWDCIYIDGGHNYRTVKHDWDLCSGSVRSGGLIVLDDSATTSSYVPPKGAFRGHPGPSRVAAEIDRSAFAEILQVGHNRVFQRQGG